MLYWCLVVLAILSCIDISGHWQFLSSLLAGFFLTILNWQIAASWLVALVDFGTSEKSKYFRCVNDHRPRYLGIVSGPWWGRQTSVATFFLVNLLDAAFLGLRAFFYFAVGLLAVEALIRLIGWTVGWQP